MDNESELPNPCSMWEVFYNTITVIFKNLESAENNLKTLANTILSSQELSNIFIPRYDLSLNASQNQSVEKQYQTFTMWLLSRLFFVLSCEKLERIHDLFIETQLKILDILRLQQPNVYDAMVQEYNGILTELNNIMSKENDEIRITLVHFAIDDTAIRNEHLNLTSKFIRIKSLQNCVSLQQKTLKILTSVSEGYMDRFYLTQLSKCILTNIFTNLEKSAPSNKIIALEYYISIARKVYFQFKYDTDLENHFRKVLNCMHFIYISEMNNTYFSLKETKEMEKLYCDMFDVLIEFEICRSDDYISKTCENLCNAIIKNKLRNETSKTDRLLHKALILLKEILSIQNILYQNIYNIVDYVIDTKRFCGVILIEYQIMEEMRKYIAKMCNNSSLDVRDISETWKILYEKMHLSFDFIINDYVELLTVANILQFSKNILHIARNTYISFCKDLVTNSNQKLNQRFEIVFVSFSDTVKKLMKIQEIYCISTNNQTKYILDILVDNFTNIISSNSITHVNQYEFELMIFVISYPFLKDLNFESIDSSTYKLLSDDLKNDKLSLAQCKAIENLSSAMINVALSDVKQYEKVNNWILNVFKFCVRSQRTDLLTEVAKYTVTLFSTSRGLVECLWDFLSELVTTNDLQVLQILTESLGSIICILSGKYIVEPHSESNKEYSMFCLYCDFTKNSSNKKTKSEEEKVYRKCDNKCFFLSQFIIQKKHIQTKNCNAVINLLQHKDVTIKRNMLRQLPRLLQHVSQMHCIPVTKQWLSFMTDEDKELRTIFANVIKLLIENCQSNESVMDQHKWNVLETCLQGIKDASQLYLKKLNTNLLESLLDVVKEIGCLNDPAVIYTTIKLLVCYILLCQTNLFLTAVDYLNRIAKSHDMTPQLLYITYKKEFCKTVAEMTVYSCCARGSTVFQCLERIALAFDVTTKDIITRDCHHLLPYFVPLFIKVPQSKKIVKDLSSIISMEPSDLFISYFPYIYPYVYVNENEEIFKESMNYIQEVTKTSIYILKRNNTKVIHSELLMHLCNKRDLILKELYNLAQEESNFSLKDSNNRIQHIVDYLKPRFLGILVYFDTKLVSRNVTKSIKKQILQSLPEILKLMGSQNITPLRFKVLAILNTALTLTEESYSELICTNWDVFVRSCEVSSLGPLLSTIIISILPLFKMHPIKISSIFKYLIAKNEKNLENYLADLFFLSETNVSAELQNIVKKYVKSQEGFVFKDKLKPFLKHINHENLDVRLYGLKYLQLFLKQNSSELKEMILDDNGMDSFLLELIEVLIAGCRRNDEKIRLASGECIGELGAIEPSHFPRKYTQKESKFPFYITDNDFVVNALKELLRAFQTEKDTQNMNRFALAIQEILKVYEISAVESAAGYRIWKEFPKNMQELMLPLLSSRYNIASQTSNKYIHPICESSVGKTYRDWLHNWVSFLISLVQNDKKQLLQVCMPSLKCDDQTLLFFLPYILVHALIESSDEERTLIYNEFMAILNFCNTPQSTQEQIQTMNLNDKTIEDKSKNDYIKVIFVLLDYLHRWLRELECIRTQGSDISLNPHYKTISTFLQLFCKLQIAQCSFQRGEYTRALLYAEEFIGRDKAKLNLQLGFLIKIYAKLEEADCVAGAIDIQETEPPLETVIIAHNMSGNLQNAAACYEKMAQELTLTPKYLKEMVRCYLDLDNPFTAFGIAEGAMEMFPDCEEMLTEAKVEAFWRLNSYDELQESLTKPEIKSSTNWGVRMGHALLNFRQGNRLIFQEETSNMRKMLVDMLSITSMEEGVYRQGYPHIINLHILNELQKAEELIQKIKEQENTELWETYVNELIHEWDLRLKIVQASVPVVEPILRLRRIILEQCTLVLGTSYENVCSILKNNIGKYWLKSAQFARKAKIYQQAYMYLLKAEQYKPASLFLEKAKLYWAQNDCELATNTLKRGLEEYFPDAATFKDMDPGYRKEDRKLCAKVKLLSATYIDETSLVDIDANIANFKEAVEIYRESEKSHVCLAQYYDKLLTKLNDLELHQRCYEMQVHIIHCYGKSLQYGSKFIYQSMPRMLSIWLDFGTQALQSSGDKSIDESKAQYLKKMTKLIDTFLDRLPPFMFFSAFSQLTSRICHPAREVYTQIKLILIKLILCYPQQSMWMLLSVSKSAYPIRTKRCQEILQDTRIKNSNVMRLIYDFNRLAEKLIELCNKPLSEGVSTTSVNSILRTLPRLLQSKEFSEIILPIQKFRKLILPNPQCNSGRHNPFPNENVYIVGIEDEVQVLQSMQRPRKITFRGSDGKKYVHMLKPKDDLRKDCRLMEFNDVVNLFLHRDADARQRRLYIRTYSVVPLNEECGIVEWLDNLVGLRPILINIYKQKGIFVGARELKSMMCNNRDSLARKRQVFEEKLLPKHPPVLSEWFKCMFPDVHFWYQARTAYIRTCAVMSIVGSILGLGDRHGENILFDSTNGDTVHVDFNCLFNKGETFDWPERVPFRLTHNMVDAMGPLGVNGLFRKSCVVTMCVLRQHKDALMSIVKPFVYDPLVSWPRNNLMKSESAEAERTNVQAVEHIRNIEMRLKGNIKTKGKMSTFVLSPVGQVDNLIEEATSIDNLSQMYIGWGAYL